MALPARHLALISSRPAQSALQRLELAEGRSGVDDESVGAEAALLDGVRTGDVAAFDRLCLAYAQRLWRFAYSIVPSREVAQDVVQDVLLSIWERRAELQLSGSLTGYLLAACRRRALYYARNSRTADRMSEQWPDEAGIAPPPEGPQRVLEREEARRMLELAIAALSDTQRQAVTLRWNQQLSYDQIAEVMQITPEAARTQVSRTYRSLRSLLVDMGMDGG